MSRVSEPFAGRTALITGGASGIGKAMGARLVELGAKVVLADIDAAGTRRASEELATRGPGTVAGMELDVSDEAAFRTAVDLIIEREGRLDLLFNNAGFAVGGATEGLTAAHWNQAIDVMLRGVINGILAAYPTMIAQGDGHIINTASAAGLVAPPFVAPYAAVKHGVVGLSTSLRPEAARHGVRVSVLCPGMVETPILDRPPPDDQPRSMTGRQYMAIARIRATPVDEFARDALDAVARNRGVIVLPVSARVQWWLHRLAPGLSARLMSYLAGQVAREIAARNEEPSPQA